MYIIINKNKKKRYSNKRKTNVLEIYIQNSFFFDINLNIYLLYQMLCTLFIKLILQKQYFI